MVGSIKNGAGQVGCPAPPEGSQHLILRPCCALPPAPPSSHTEASTGLSEELPKNRDVPKSPLPPIGRLNAVGRHDNILKNRPMFVPLEPPALATCTPPLRHRASQ